MAALFSTLQKQSPEAYSANLPVESLIGSFQIRIEQVFPS